MIKSIKRMVLTGAAVMVMMSFAAPAMAMDLTNFINPSAAYTDYGSSFDRFVYRDLFNPCNCTAGDQIPVEAGGPTHTDGPVVVGPAPQNTSQDNSGDDQAYPHNRGGYRG